MKPLLIILAITLLFHDASSQDTLRVGHPLFEGAVVPIGTVTITSYRLEDDHRAPTSSAIQSVTTGDEAGLPIYRISNLHVSAGDTTVTEIIIRRSDLSMIRHSVRARNDSASVLYSNGFLSGWVVLPEKPVLLIDTKTGGPVFPVDGPASWFLSALPLREGFAAVIPRYSMWKDEETMMEVRVVGEEAVEQEDGMIDCWKVDSGPFAIPGYRAYHWVDKDSRQIIQSALIGPEGKPEYWSIRERE